ncbi:hypothetical protein NHX12_019823 [Muraenolepis orangiensis]|uniref:Immunoglobulin V-set domain-containing protein n=1 Tax=Muraenolepis orangiensis TaxID=630683 RepID=A0A9Q0EXG7_9TELE|nr:hypothetical protein NHX12_019823 [Muraenolepis orangiensis]
MAFYTSIIAALLLTLQGLEGYTLTQEKTLSVNRGDTVKISCTQSGTSTMSLVPAEKWFTSKVFTLYIRQCSQRSSQSYFFSWVME